MLGKKDDDLIRLPYPVSAKYLAALQGIRMELHGRWPNQKLPAEDAKTLECFTKRIRSGTAPANENSLGRQSDDSSHDLERVQS
ncbi:hypothetical protein [Paenibacillus sp. MBLB4367]|uniref:hypothetical protein n=1 Tax=Paenibacillus sp. MBLB4367 TaxID=3384767 RepID=UPI00390800C1